MYPIFLVNSYLEIIELANKLHADVQSKFRCEDIDVYAKDENDTLVKVVEIFIEYEGYNIEIYNKEVLNEN